MSKRFWWVFLLTTGVAAFLWQSLSRAESKKNEAGSISNQKISMDRPATQDSDLAGEERHHEIARESSRHSSDEVQRHQAEELRLADLKKAVRNQEEKVEERKKVLATIVRTKGIVYKGDDSFSPNPVNVAEEGAKKSLDAAEYMKAKEEFEADQELLQKLKIKLITEQRRGKQSGR